MVEAIPDCAEFRMHVSGDMLSAEYIHKWIEICANRPDVTFYTYTRSWTIPELWKAIRILADLPNVNVNLSCDKDTGKPFDGYRWCYLTHDDIVPDWIRAGDIVFRSLQIGQKRKRKADEKKGIDPDIRAPLVHKLGAGTVCPKERGKDIPNLSCKTCHLCVDKPLGRIPVS